jgi:CRISPR-associated exonuclease Cas4
MMQNTDHYLRINELKNTIYCPRISYYALCLHLDRTTPLAELGIAAEQDTRRRMRRRKHALHAAVDGTRAYNVPVWSHPWQLVGQVDEVIDDGQSLYLVDYKDVEKDHGYWKVQMAAYKHCAEETFDRPVAGCFVYSIPQHTYHEVKVTARTTNTLIDLLDDLHQMIGMQVCPPPIPHYAKCRQCQYRRFCNDVR